MGPAKRRLFLAEPPNFARHKSLYGFSALHFELLPLPMEYNPCASWRMRVFFVLPASACPRPWVRVEASTVGNPFLPQLYLKPLQLSSPGILTSTRPQEKHEAYSETSSTTKIAQERRMKSGNTTCGKASQSFGTTKLIFLRCLLPRGPVFGLTSSNLSWAWA